MDVEITYETIKIFKDLDIILPAVSNIIIGGCSESYCDSFIMDAY